MDRVKTILYSTDRLRRIIHFIVAAVLFNLPFTFRARLFQGKQYYCPLCENQLNLFLKLRRDYHLFCPICLSLKRHRFVWLFMKHYTDLGNGLPKKLLHIAPQLSVSHSLKNIENLEYISGDLNDKNAMVKLDICNIKYPSNTFDVILCCHVLEHVEDDQKAIREMSRVLKPDGWAVLMVPITSSITYENPSIKNPVEREREFGQFDHLRRYGPDFVDRLKENGFSVQEFKANELVDEVQITRMGLIADEILYFCNKR